VIKRCFLFFIVITFITSACQRTRPVFVSITGYTQGGSFHIKYQPNTDSVSSEEIYQLLNDISHSLSIYDTNSIICHINRNDTLVKLDRYFCEIFQKAYHIYQQTDGLFDITVAPLVKHWGFIPKDSIVDQYKPTDSLLDLIGMNKIRMENNRLIKKNKNMQIDVNAIAQGYTVDKLALLLESKGIKNYMIEVGGEVRVNGVNDKGEPWNVGIDKPIEQSDETNRELQTIVSITNTSLATSGNYRKFIEINGVKYSHIINPKTGMPVHQRLLSVTVVMPSCTDADALATAIMVMGLEKGKSFVLQHSSLDAYFIYSDEKGNLQTWMTKGLEKNCTE